MDEDTNCNRWTGESGKRLTGQDQKSFTMKRSGDGRRYEMQQMERRRWKTIYETRDRDGKRLKRRR